MNLYKILLVLIILSSCSGTSQTKQLSTSVDENWEIAYKTIQTNTYSKSGLLDTSYSTSFVYMQGMLVDTSKSITVRKYDSKNNLISEKTFLLSNNIPSKLLSEAIKEYDEKNNPIYIMTKSEGVNYDRSRIEYNNNNQEIKSVDIFQVMENASESMDIDSIALRKKDTKKLTFDTTINTYNYDDIGNLIKWISSNTKGEIEKTNVTIYSGKEKTSGYALDNNGDTTVTFTYIKDGDILKEIAKTNEDGGVDTTWQQNDKVLKMIGHSEKFHFKTKMEIKYNDKGDEIESISYR
jgi:hypothetical protein